MTATTATGATDGPAAAAGAVATAAPVALQWSEMLTVALLGTDRREPPAPAAGLPADLAADEPRDSPSQRMLQQAAAITVLRRAGLRPAAPVAECSSPPPDRRPITPASATHTWRRIVADWPVLEDEWLLVVARDGWRLAPELVGPMLARHRHDATRRARVFAAAGPLAPWLVGHQPDLAAIPGRSPDAEAIAHLPHLPMLPELAAELDGDGRTVTATVADGLSRGDFGVAHRAVLANFVARVRADVLVGLAVALGQVDPSRPAIGVAYALADLARLRTTMLAELELR